MQNIIANLIEKNLPSVAQSLLENRMVEVNATLDELQRYALNTSAEVESAVENYMALHTETTNLRIALRDALEEIEYLKKSNAKLADTIALERVLSKLG
ncbi:hypothetical protein HCZ30_16310 [Marivivens donghaensis]|uniref:Uncharacterized protein n=1 Tax=Marivivens donghaensis TaxID=1699413 RepID=A0ABX0W3Z6_9RHOB|nr:hypothetical protein [Marivivens donghaensis]NIY73989.1 hypothetical protein [Marivivens donghaensis]